jgi:hypothetical protein
MGFILILCLIVVLIVAYYLAPIIERFFSNYASGLFGSKNKKNDKSREEK